MQTRELDDEKSGPPKKPALPIKAPLEKQALKLKREAKIKAIGFRTEPSGKWLFTYDIQNTGAATLNLRQAQFKTFQILQNGGRIPVHTVNTGLELRPGQSMTGCLGWNRSSSAIRLQLEMHYEGVLLDTMTTDVPPLDIDITRAACDPAKHKWTTSLKNNTASHLLPFLSLPTIAFISILFWKPSPVTREFSSVKTWARRISARKLKVS